MRPLIRRTALFCALALPHIAPAQQCQEQRLASPDGYGVLVKSNCERHEGDFRSGMLHGKGKITRPNYRTEEGDFLRNRLWGNGKITYQDNRVAEGQFVDGRMSGVGKLTWPDGRFHEGLFHNGSPAGPGRFRSHHGEIFEGMFESAGALEGRGVMTKTDGTKTIGEFRGNRPVGEVIVIRPDGSEEKQTYTWNHQLVRAPAATDAERPPSEQPKSREKAASKADDPQHQKGASPDAGQVIQEVDRALRGLRGIFGK